MRAAQESRGLSIRTRSRPLAPRLVLRNAFVFTNIASRPEWSAIEKLTSDLLVTHAEHGTLLPPFDAIQVCLLKLFAPEFWNQEAGSQNIEHIDRRENGNRKVK